MKWKQSWHNMRAGTEENNEKTLPGQYQLGWESNIGLKNTKQKQYTVNHNSTAEQTTTND